MKKFILSIFAAMLVTGAWADGFVNGGGGSTTGTTPSQVTNIINSIALVNPGNVKWTNNLGIYGNGIGLTNLNVPAGSLTNLDTRFWTNNTGIYGNGLGLTNLSVPTSLTNLDTRFWTNNTGYYGNGVGLTNVYVPVALTNLDSRIWTNNTGYYGNAVGLTNLQAGGITNVALLNTNNTFTGGTNSFNSVYATNYYGNGLGLTNLQASVITNVALLNASNTFTGGTNYFNSIYATNHYGNGLGLTNLQFGAMTNVALLNASNTFLGGTNYFQAVYATNYYGNGFGLTNVIGTNVVGVPQTMTAISLVGFVDNFYEINVRNATNGPSASSDFVATANNGNDTNYYVNFGINGSGFVSSSAWGGSNNGYLYYQGSFTNGTGGAFEIGNNTTNGTVYFITRNALNYYTNLWMDGLGMYGDAAGLTNLQLKGITTNTFEFRLSGTTYRGIFLNTNGNLTAAGSVIATNGFSAYVANATNGFQVFETPGYVGKPFQISDTNNNPVWFIDSNNVANGNAQFLTNFSLNGPSSLYESNQNIRIGSSAGASNILGQSNTALGFQTLNRNVNGSFNSAFGNNALYYNNGSYNIGIGYQAAQVMGGVGANGDGNVFIGANSGVNTPNQTNSIFLGNNSGSALSTVGSSNIIVGSVGVNGDNLVIRIGTPGIQNSNILAGVVYANGGGLTNVSSATGVYTPVKTVTAATYTALMSDEFIIVDSTAATVTITLPTSNVPTGKKIVVHKLVAANSMTVQSATSNTLILSSGALGTTESFTAQYVDIPYIWTGTYWAIYA